MDCAVTITLWRFVRGDMPATAFEKWLYAQEQLEKDLGEPLFLEVVSFDYRNTREIYVIREKLGDFLRPKLKCECITLPDLAVVPMGCDGLDARVFASLRRVGNHGGSQWWLYFSRCEACNQNWMVAQEDRIFDDFFLKRLQPLEVSQIEEENIWPSEFNTYENLLKIGIELSKPCGFVDPAAPALIHTIQDLRAARPSITPNEIARLIGVDSALVERAI